MENEFALKKAYFLQRKKNALSILARPQFLNVKGYSMFFSFDKQEMFSDGCWGNKASMRQMLKVHGLPFSTKTVQSPTSLHNAGIFIGMCMLTLHGGVSEAQYHNGSA